ncbi:latrophilin-like protein 1 isoform X2 [Palaemon carinicauda]
MEVLNNVKADKNVTVQTVTESESGHLNVTVAIVYSAPKDLSEDFYQSINYHFYCGSLGSFAVNSQHLSFWPLKEKCKEDQNSCRDGKCILGYRICDENCDCLDGSNESDSCARLPDNTKITSRNGHIVKLWPVSKASNVMMTCFLPEPQVEWCRVGGKKSLRGVKIENGSLLFQNVGPHHAGIYTCRNIDNEEEREQLTFLNVKGIIPRFLENSSRMVIHHNTTLVNNSFTIDISFKTLTESGIILSLYLSCTDKMDSISLHGSNRTDSISLHGSNRTDSISLLSNRTDSISLHLSNRTAIFSYEVNEVKKEIRSEIHIDKWHSLQLKLSQDGGSMTLDNKSTKRDKQKLNLTSGFGKWIRLGNPSIFQINDSLTSFNGCISRLAINQAVVELKGFLQMNITQCDTCANNSCPVREFCYEAYATNGYECIVPSNSTENTHDESIEDCYAGPKFCTATERELRPYKTPFILNTTLSGSSTNVSCPENQGSTDGVWKCSSEGQWEDAPDLSNCRSSASSYSLSNESSPSENLGTLTDSIQNLTFAPGDVIKILGDLDSLSKQLDEDLTQFGNSSETFFEELVNATDTVMKNSEVWNYMSKDKAKASSTLIQENIVRSSLAMAKSHPSNRTIVRDVKNINLAVVIQPKQYYDREDNRLFKHNVTQTSIKLPEKFYETGTTFKSPDRLTNDGSENVVVAFNVFHNLHCITNTVPCNPDGINISEIEGTEQVNSEVIGATLGFESPWEAKHDNFVMLNFTHIYNGSTYKLSNATCKWWNTTAQVWSPEGCNRSEQNEFYTICKCKHLTNFAVVMDISGVLEKNTTLYKFLTLATQIGSTSSVVCLGIGAICFWLLKVDRDKKKNPVGSKKYLIRLHFCICLMLAQTVLLLGLEKTDNMSTRICTTVAVTLHYFFLATFTWSAIEAFNLYLAVWKVFDVHIASKWYLFAGYSIPSYVVGATLALNGKDGYGTDQNCWLEPNGLLWSFAGTVATILLINTVAFAMVMHIVCKSRAVGDSRANSNRPTCYKFIGSITIFIILGLTWSFGFLYMTAALSQLSIVFTVFNSLQGVSLLLFGIILDLDVRRELKEIIMDKIYKSYLSGCCQRKDPLLVNGLSGENSLNIELSNFDKTQSTDLENDSYSKESEETRTMLSLPRQPRGRKVAEICQHFEK